MDEDEYFETLLPYIEEGRVIPVVGPDLVTVTHQGRTVPLNRAVAEQVLQYYGKKAATDQLPPVQSPADEVLLRPAHELNDAVCAVINDRRRDVYSSVQRALNDVVQADLQTALRPLLDLASVSAFSLFSTTTVDDLLARSIDQVRHRGAAKTRQILHVPNLPTDEFRDITEADLASAQFTAVLYLFGKARNAQLFAIHDEDTLEYVYNLQTRGSNVPERFIGKLRTNDLLLIGCYLPDWLGRFFLRLSSQSRLGDDRRPKREFLVGTPEGSGDGLIVFLERFSSRTSMLKSNPQHFVAELARRWRERHPAEAEAAATAAAPLVPVPAADDTIFISYSRADFPAAQRLRDELKSIGIDSVWFDHSALKAGHDWAREITIAIRRCYLFLPLISANTEAREKGYFREEWTQAAEQVRQVEGRAYIVPVVIDPAYAGNAGAYKLVPEMFARRQFGHAPDGALSPSLREQLVGLIRERRLPKSI